MVEGLASLISYLNSWLRPRTPQCSVQGLRSSQTLLMVIEMKCCSTLSEHKEVPKQN